MTDATEEFPAAHSMDTCWFGVDSKGRLAMFDTDEGGAAPLNARPEDHWSGAFEHLAADADGCRPIAVDGAPLAALCPAERLQEYYRLHRDFDFGHPVSGYEKRFTDNIALLCAGPAELPDVAKTLSAARERGDDAAPLRFAGPDPLLFFATCDLPTLGALIEAGQVIGVSPPADQFERDESDYSYYNWFLPYLGLYRFECGEAVATPYFKAAAPDDAFTPAGGATAAPFFAALPEVDFDAVSAIQPVPLFDCAAWDGAWWSVDGAAHNVGGDGGDLSDEVRAPSDPERLRLALLPEGAEPPEFDFDAFLDD